MKHKIIYSLDARDDILEIVSWQQEKHGPDKAYSVYKKLKEKIDALLQFPETGRVVPELMSIGVNEIRELIEYPWRIFYKLNDKTLQIISIIDGRRDVQEILYKKIIDGKLT
ncbi:type II toxin-antitoxin system RelE/ParE family toxin [Spirochaeta dissipatitropha]